MWYPLFYVDRRLWIFLLHKLVFFMNQNVCVWWMGATCDGWSERTSRRKRVEMHQLSCLFEFRYVVLKLWYWKGIIMKTYFILPAGIFMVKSQGLFVFSETCTPLSFCCFELCYLFVFFYFRNNGMGECSNGSVWWLPPKSKGRALQCGCEFCTHAVLCSKYTEDYTVSWNTILDCLIKLYS